MSDYSIYNSGTLTINDFGGTTIVGTVFINNGSTFNYGGSGIASGTVVYLNNTNGNSDAYITLTGALTSTHLVQCANPASGIEILHASSSSIANSSINYLSYNGGNYSFVRYGSTIQLI